MTHASLVLFLLSSSTNTALNWLRFLPLLSLPPPFFCSMPTLIPFTSSNIQLLSTLPLCKRNVCNKVLIFLLWRDQNLISSLSLLTVSKRPWEQGWVRPLNEGMIPVGFSNYNGYIIVAALP